MNELPPLRADEIRSQIFKVQRFSRFARGCCTWALVLVGLLALSGLWMTFWPTSVKFGLKLRLGAIVIEPHQITHFGMKIAVTIVLCVGVGIICAALLHLHHLFDNFSRAQIYTHDNVRHIRALGLIALLGATLQFLEPIFASILVGTGVIDASLAGPDLGRIELGKAISPFATAGLILLASWIMDVGKNYSDEAEHLRSEAELVV